MAAGVGAPRSLRDLDRPTERLLEHTPSGAPVSEMIAAARPIDGTKQELAMKARRISAVLCSGDLGQSQTFYEQVVGLTLSAETIPNHLLFECGDGTTLLVYGRPAPNKADHTQVRFWTDDVERDVRELASRGAVFEDYDFPTLKTVDHVATTAGLGKSAWFKDPDGNTLALFEPE
jgi:catechol 2,3-dioxygenase-like lactoylglutathione lyase family enzyme